ncbi:hypothetical protein [Kitasatospora sp. A2-31]|uniref:DUF6907 domain-containing protein n=1 Tax=Kitasatospora sp. A2-31 TaxID=2916414 RepID=UPI001EE9D918|nr:hypothetical protein [Kitasatospora sp. A2-31]MCG6497643.1 hypothetical protein [Kitasatospora sp. A2-31]
MKTTSTARCTTTTETPDTPLTTAIDRVRTQASAAIAARPGRLTTSAPVWGNTIITIPEPSWCTLDHHNRLDHPEDLYHTSSETAVTVTRANGETEELLSCWLADNPYGNDSPYGDTGLRAAVAFHTGDVEDYDEAGLARLAAELRAAAALVDRLAAQLTDARLTRHTGVEAC